MDEKPNIAAILAAAKEKKLALEAQEAAQKAAAETQAEPETAVEDGAAAELEKQQAADQRVDDFKSKQERLSQIQEQRDADAESLKAIRDKLRGDRQELRDLKLPEEDHKEALGQITEASTDETAGGEVTRGEFRTRSKETREEKVGLKKDIDESLSDPSFQAELQDREARDQEKSRLEIELKQVEEAIALDSEALPLIEEMGHVWEKINADTSKVYGERYEWAKQFGGESSFESKQNDLLRKIKGFEDLLQRLNSGSEIPASIKDKYPDAKALELRIDQLKQELAPSKAKWDEFESRIQQIEKEKESAPDMTELGKKYGKIVRMTPENIKSSIGYLNERKKSIQERINALGGSK